MSVEEWRPIEGFEGCYEVSSEGRVRSLSRTIIRRDGKPLTLHGMVLDAKPNSRGYPRVTLSAQGHPAWRTVHSLVAAAFLPLPPGPIGSGIDEYTVNHKDGDKTNNRVINLEYVTGANNVLHAREAGLLDVRGSKNGRAKVTPELVREIRGLYAQGARQVDLAEMFGIDQTNISRIVRRASWAEVA